MKVKVVRMVNYRHAVIVHIVSYPRDLVDAERARLANFLVGNPFKGDEGGQYCHQ
jgi:hypothetical protein